MCKGFLKEDFNKNFSMSTASIFLHWAHFWNSSRNNIDQFLHLYKCDNFESQIRGINITFNTKNITIENTRRNFLDLIFFKWKQHVKILRNIIILPISGCIKSKACLKRTLRKIPKYIKTQQYVFKMIHYFYYSIKVSLFSLILSLLGFLVSAPLAWKR